MKNTYSPHTYKCPKCKTITKHYAWSNELTTTTQTCTCGTTLKSKNLHIVETPDAPAIRTPTKNR